MIEYVVVGNLETTGYYALGIPVIFGVLIVELNLERRQFSLAETISNLSAGLGTLVIGLFVGPGVYALWSWAYRGFAVLDWHGVWWRWPIALLVSDFCYYVHHRAGHRFAFLWAIHGVHHQHEYLNSTVGLRLEWLADLSTVVFFSLMPLLGFDPYTGFLTVSLLSLYTLTTHAPSLKIPGFGVLVTASSHGAHHSRDARYEGKNYGAMFTFWDRLFGTYKPHDWAQPLRVDVPTICRVHDGVSAQFSLMRELFADVRNASSLREAFWLLAGRPIHERPGAPVPRDESRLARQARIYLTADFAATTLLATWLLWARDSNPFAVKLGGAALVIWSLRAVGGHFDGRPRALEESALRWLAALALAAAVASFSPVFAVLLAAGSVAGLFALAVLKENLGGSAVPT